MPNWNREGCALIGDLQESVGARNLRKKLDASAAATLKKSIKKLLKSIKAARVSHRQLDADVSFELNTSDTCCSLALDVSQRSATSVKYPYYKLKFRTSACLCRAGRHVEGGQVVARFAEQNTCKEVVIIIDRAAKRRAGRVTLQERGVRSREGSLFWAAHHVIYAK